MSAGSPTVRLLLLAQSIPPSPLLLLSAPSSRLSFRTCLFAHLSPSVFSPFLPPSVFLPSSRFPPSSLLLSSPFFKTQHWRVYSRRSLADADFPPRMLLLVIYKGNVYFFKFELYNLRLHFPKIINCSSPSSLLEKNSSPHLLKIILNITFISKHPKLCFSLITLFHWNPSFEFCHVRSKQQKKKKKQKLMCVKYFTYLNTF